jgi:hypothetical protein
MFCPKCGATNDDTSKFCLTCGSPLGQPAAAAPPPQPVMQPPVQNYYQPPPPAAPVKKSHTGIIVVIVLILVIAIGAAAVFFVMSKKDDKKDDKATTTQASTSAVTTTKKTADNETTATEASGQPSSDQVLGILNGLGYNDWDGNWNSLTAEQKAAIENYYSALGENIKFTEDGLVMVDENGNVISWGGKWPSSALLADVPKANFGSIFSSSVEADTVAIVISGATVANFTEYVSKVKSAGFNNDISEVNVMGAATYTASNGKGVEITVVNYIAMTGLLAITVEKV